MNKETDKNILAKILEFPDLVEYQTNSVISRTIIGKGAGTVTLFAFDKGEALSEHVAPFDALVYIVDGKAQINISGESFNLKKGQTIIMPANKPHSLSAVERFKMVLVMIKV